jgi:hypothetical protein
VWIFFLFPIKPKKIHQYAQMRHVQTMTTKSGLTKTNMYIYIQFFFVLLSKTLGLPPRMAEKVMTAAIHMYVFFCPKNDVFFGTFFDEKKRRVKKAGFAILFSKSGRQPNMRVVHVHMHAHVIVFHSFVHA